MPDNNEESTRTVRTEGWVLDVPRSTTIDAPLICIPTIHPRGDQRILRCAQTALNAGYRVKFFWLGLGDPSTDPTASEEILPAAHSFKERILQLPSLALKAHREASVGWHIHDFYMLPFALLFRFISKKRVIYDVHEYYPTYYSDKMHFPRLTKRLTALAISNFQVWAAKILGGANVVAAPIAEDFILRNVPLSVTPNYPLERFYKSVPIPMSDMRWKKIIHSGTLSEAYGMKAIIDLAAECQERKYSVQFDLIRRFPNAVQENIFHEYLEQRGRPENLRLIDPVPSYKLPSLLSNYGIGLSMIFAEGQNDVAVPTKLYEYVLMGLSVVGTKRKAQHAFLNDFGVAELFRDSDISGFADAIGRLSQPDPDTSQKIRDLAMHAREKLFWEEGPQVDLTALYSVVFGDGRQRNS